MFKSKGQKLAERFAADYLKTFKNTYQSVITQKGQVNRAELERLHELAAQRAFKNQMDRGHKLLAVDALAQECFEVAVQQVGWVEPAPTPSPQNEFHTLTDEQQQEYRAMYDVAFDQWMAPRIEQGSASAEDFARADFFASTKAEEVVDSIGISISDADHKRLCDEQYKLCVERAGYTNVLGTPLPKMGIRQ